MNPGCPHSTSCMHGYCCVNHSVGHDYYNMKIYALVDLFPRLETNVICLESSGFTRCVTTHEQRYDRKCTVLEARLRKH